VNRPSLCAQIRPELGVYVLGAIAPADRAAVSRHLASCPRCREEVAELSGLPALLRKVPVADAMQLSGERPPDHSGPPEALVDGLVGRAGAVRRRRRWGLAAAATVLAAVAAVGWALQVSQPAASLLNSYPMVVFTSLFNVTGQPGGYPLTGQVVSGM
jgi:anti-sigma factor RsiW